MGANRDCLSIWIMFCALMVFQIQHGEASENEESLNSFLHDYALHSIPKHPRTGRAYEVSPPANMSGGELWVLRLRAHSLWSYGANMSSVEIPSMALPSPFTRRVDLVYQNLGNWSTSYHNLPGYTFVAPVVGLLVYDSNTSTLLNIDLRGDMPIIVNFSGTNVSVSVRLMQCVRFATDGTVEFSNVTGESSCEARSIGHFSIVVPAMRERKTVAVKWWMVGVPAVLVGVVFIGVVLRLVWRWRNLKKLDRISERSEGLNSIWIGNSRMPYASAVRTQPNLENNYIP